MTEALTIKLRPPRTWRSVTVATGACPGEFMDWPADVQDRVARSIDAFGQRLANTEGRVIPLVILKCAFLDRGQTPFKAGVTQEWWDRNGRFQLEIILQEDVSAFDVASASAH